MKERRRGSFGMGARQLPRDNDNEPGDELGALGLLADTSCVVGQASASARGPQGNGQAIRGEQFSGNPQKSPV